MNNYTRLCCALVFASSAYADEKYFFNQWQQATQKHDLVTLQKLIEPNTVIEVLWIDAEPNLRFVMTAAQYLQQVKALWRFGSEESYHFDKVNWNRKSDVNLQLSFSQTEKRVLFDKASGQRSELLIDLVKTQDSWRANYIKATVSMW
ncbi:MAG: hypothetical protein KDI39_16085 [Pseudomonadales bacterium]|nr:hypothetical protein [Pseudomonadales bacterium]